MQPVRGTHDLLFQDAEKHRYIVNKTLEIAQTFGFSEIQTPIFEFSKVFNRTLGEDSDIVSKEMYTFTDRGGDELCLRPEGTAGIVRSFISNQMQRQLPLKFFYHGPMFRYERPQKGRFRQFHQIGVELLGPASLQADVEILSLSSLLLKELNLQNKTTLEINTIGDSPSRLKYKKALIDYLEPYKAELSEDSQRRLRTNPLRILDSKSEQDIKISAQAPTFKDFLSAESLQRFDQIKAALEKLKISFTVNTRLVRGLDYYNDLVFEFKANDLGAQDAVLSGGRYDSLVETMGGPSTPGIGWAAGLERLALLTEWVSLKSRPFAIIPLGGEAENLALEIAHQMRSNGLFVEMAYAGSMGSRLKKANKSKCLYCVVLGENEIKNSTVTVKNLDTGEQKILTMDDFYHQALELKAFS